MSGGHVMWAILSEVLTITTVKPSLWGAAIVGIAAKVRYQFRLERSNEYRIKQTIRRHYDHTTRPVRNDKTAINVLVAISLYHILDTVRSFSER